MSDGPAWGDANARTTDPRSLIGLTAEAAAKRLAFEAAVRRSAALYGALKVAMAIAGPLAASIPGGPTGAELLRIGVDIVERETT